MKWNWHNGLEKLNKIGETTEEDQTGEKYSNYEDGEVLWILKSEI